MKIAQKFDFSQLLFSREKLRNAKLKYPISILAKLEYRLYIPTTIPDRVISDISDLSGYDILSVRQYFTLPPYGRYQNMEKEEWKGEWKSS